MYFKGKWRGAARKGQLSGCVGSFRIHPKETGLFNSPRPEHSERGLLLSAAH